MAYSVDDRIFQSVHSYKCRYEDVAWLSERGSAWDRRNEDEPIYATGNLPDGTRFVIEPVDRRKVGPKYTCANSGNIAINSELFVRSKEDSQALQSYDAQRTAAKDHTIRLLKSVLRRRTYGASVFKPATSARKQRSTYYTISARVISGPDIDREGLRDYVNSRKSIWLEGDAQRPFPGWTSEDVDAARKYGETKPFLFYPQAGVELSCEHTKQGWIFSKTSIKPVTWFPTEVENLRVNAPVKPLPTTWVHFENTILEIPLARHLGLHFYNVRMDELVVFYVYRIEVLDNLL